MCLKLQIKIHNRSKNMLLSCVSLNANDPFRKGLCFHSLCLGYYSNNKQNIGLVLTIISVALVLTWRCSSSSAWKVYSLYELKKFCQFELLISDFLTARTKSALTESWLFYVSSQIHTRLCQKHKVHTQSVMSANINRCMCMSIWELWNGVSWTWRQYTTNAFQPGLYQFSVTCICISNLSFLKQH